MASLDGMALYLSSSRNDATTLLSRSTERAHVLISMRCHGENLQWLITQYGSVKILRLIKSKRESLKMMRELIGA